MITRPAAHDAIAATAAAFVVSGLFWRKKIHRKKPHGKR
jgi:hypothetical protein